MNELFTRQHQLKHTTSPEITRSKIWQNKSKWQREKKTREDFSRNVKREEQTKERNIKNNACVQTVCLCEKISITKEKQQKSVISPGTHTHRSSSNSISIFLSLSFVSPFLPFLPLLCTLFVRLSRSHCAFLYDDFCCFAFHVSGRTSVGIYMKMLPFYLSTTTLLISPNRCLLFAKFLISHVSSSFFLLKEYRHNFFIAHSHDYAFEAAKQRKKKEWGRKISNDKRAWVFLIRYTKDRLTECHFQPMTLSWE